MTEGWIKLHRQIRDNPFYTNPAALSVWVECLLRASHAERDFYLKREKVTLQAGQFVIGRDEFGKAIGISGSTAWYWLLQFESDSMVDIKKTAKGSIVSVKNWVKYQVVDSTSDNRKTADEQQMNTNKKVKNDNNEKTTVVFEKSLTRWLRQHGKGEGYDHWLIAEYGDAIEKAWKKVLDGREVKSPADFVELCKTIKNV